MMKEEAEKAIQEKLAELSRIFEEEIKPLANEHKVEFSWMGMTMHYRDWYDRKKIAKTGFFISDLEWESSGLSCNEYNGFDEWRRENWPEDYNDD